MALQRALRHKVKLQQMQLDTLPQHQLEVQLKRWRQRRQPQKTHLVPQQPLKAQMQQQCQSQQHKMALKQALCHQVKLQQVQLHPPLHHHLEVQLKRWQQRRQPQKTHLVPQQRLKAQHKTALQ